jgi:hypothetical protein
VAAPSVVTTACRRTAAAEKRTRRLSRAEETDRERGARRGERFFCFIEGLQQGIRLRQWIHRCTQPVKWWATPVGDHERGVGLWVAAPSDAAPGVQGIFPAGPWARRPRPVKSGGLVPLQWAKPIYHFFNCSKIFQLPNRFKFANYEKGTSIAPKISTLYMVEDKFKRRNFHFGKEFKFPTEFELQIQEGKQI